MGRVSRHAPALTSGGPPDSHPEMSRRYPSGIRPDVEQQSARDRVSTPGSEDSDDPLPVDEVHAPELGARDAGLEEAAGE